jgi:hypothetical protein
VVSLIVTCWLWNIDSEKSVPIHPPATSVLSNVDIHDALGYIPHDHIDRTRQPDNRDDIATQSERQGD